MNNSVILPGRTPFYFVTDHALNGGRSKLDVIAAALSGGIQLIQYRDKELSDADFAAEAAAALALCRRHGAVLLVNDRVELAGQIGADGVHLGQEDMPPEEARRRLGPAAVIGLSTHNEAEVKAAGDRPLDYINIGPLFPTRTKPHTHALGIDEVLRLAGMTRHAWCTMGGIARAQVGELFRRGVKTAAMVTAISLADNIEQSVTDLLAEAGAANLPPP